MRSAFVCDCSIRLMARRWHRHNVYFMARDLILGDGPEVRGAIGELTWRRRDRRNPPKLNEFFRKISRSGQTTGSVSHVSTYPYFLNHRCTFEYRSNIAGALIVCSSGGIGAAKGGIPSNFKIISIGFFPDSLIRIIDL